MGEVVDFAQARKRLERVKVGVSEPTPLQQKVSVSEELRTKITSHSICKYWPVPGSPAAYVSFPLIGALSREATQVLREMTVAVVLQECGDDMSFLCDVTHVRQGAYQLDLKLALRETEPQSRFETSIMCGDVRKMRFVLGGFSVVRERFLRDIILPF